VNAHPFEAFSEAISLGLIEARDRISLLLRKAVSFPRRSASASLKLGGGGKSDTALEFSEAISLGLIEAARR